MHTIDDRQRAISALSLGTSVPRQTPKYMCPLLHSFTNACISIRVQSVSNWAGASVRAISIQTPMTASVSAQTTFINIYKLKIYKERMISDVGGS